MANADLDDSRFRQAAFQHLTSLLTADGAVTRDMMAVPFFVDDERCTLVDPRRGIHKPRAMRHLLSITTVMAGSGRRTWYADQETVHAAIYSGDDSILYSFMGTDPTAAQNRALKEAADLRLPIIYFLGIKPGLYTPIFPAYLTEWDAQGLAVRIVFSPQLGTTGRPFFPADAIDRRYAMRLVKQRMHQCQFREAVIDAYGGRCAISKLPEPRLLDAAHIVRDADEELGHPIVPNGLPLSKIHHAAYDAHLLGIDADGIVHVSERLLEIHDGPFLEHGIKAARGMRILMPSRTDDRPDRDRLDRRFQQFKKVA
jgi:putative restriction endonuclease